MSYERDVDTQSPPRTRAEIGKRVGIYLLAATGVASAIIVGAKYLSDVVASPPPPVAGCELTVPGNGELSDGAPFTESGFEAQEGDYQLTTEQLNPDVNSGDLIPGVTVLKIDQSFCDNVQSQYADWYRQLPRVNQ